MIRLLKYFVIFFVVFVIFIIWFFVYGFTTNQPGKFYNKGSNAIWLGHQWVSEEKSDMEIKTLVDTLKKHQIKTVFVHTGPIKPDGWVDDETYPFAISFLEKAKKYDDTIVYQAWLGQLRSNLDLSNKSVRDKTVLLSVKLTEAIGFDGVHFDIEPVWDEDLDFIELLEEVNLAISNKKIISVALAEYIPKIVIHTYGLFHDFKNYNTEVNYLNVAKYADEVAVMVYDTGIKKSWYYRWLVKEQTIGLTRLYAKNPDVKIYIGLPCYEEVKEGFDPKTENIENGLRGLLWGLNDMRSKLENFKGVAIYPYWEMDETEWSVYDRLWLN